jgi:predicted lysophospholipase L1 biosynthesis ABC-type transport system permease subunit
MRVVGRMVAPSVGDLFTNSLDDGGWISGAFVHQANAFAKSNPNVPPPPPFTLFAVRYASGVSSAEAFASLRHDFGATVLRQLPAADALNLQSVDRLPIILAGLVVVLGGATVGNTLVTSVRRRRRELATLKTLGFVRRQVAATVGWQSTSFASVAVVVGLPIGVAAGRWAWYLVASGIGSVSPATVPAIAIAVIVPGTLLVANGIATAPAWSAARIPPAVVLRSE